MKNKEKFKELQDRLNQAKAIMVAEAKDLFNNVVKDLFEEFPAMNNFSWTQYTPYFNDGDSCSFGVNSEADINGISSGEIHQAWLYRDWQKKVTNSPASNPELIPAKEAVQELLEAAPSEMLEFIFGDHMRVTIYRDGTLEAEEYSHE